MCAGPYSVVVRSDVHPAAVTALDVIYLDPPPVPSPASSFNGAASPRAAGSIAAAAADLDGAPGPAVLLASASHDMVWTRMYNSPCHPLYSVP
jgi:hypothetical protein